jgi:hypothetical protein
MENAEGGEGGAPDGLGGEVGSMDGWDWGADGN